MGTSSYPDKTWKYKNTTLLLFSLLAFYYLAQSTLVRNFIAGIGNLGYFGAFVAGIFFVSTFTVAPATVVLFYLAGRMNPFEIAILAGLGAVVGDYVIFKFLKDRVFEELKPLFHRVKGSYLSRLFRTPYFAWLLPIIGGFIIASPFPDEVGVGILGISRLKNWQFITLSFVLNATGIFIIVTIANYIGI